MKKLIAILLIACLLTGFGALAQDGEGAEADKLPAPEEVAGIEAAADEPAEEAAAEDVAEDAVEEPAGDAAGVPGATEIPEAEPTGQPPEEGESIDLWFEEGFGLSLPEGWVSYAVSDEDRGNGVRYALGDGTGEHLLYIRFTPTAIGDAGALSEAAANTEGLEKTGELSFGGTDFVAFIDARQNLSCCATIFNGELVAFMFTPQTDSDFMLVASRMMESFRVL